MLPARPLTPLDRLIASADSVLRIVSGVSHAGRPTPAQRIDDAAMDAKEQRHAAGLMRVNHVGEVCAQALYNAQARFAKSEVLREQFEQAAREEEDHLAWTAERLKELGARPSLFNPLWYGGAYAIGAVAAHLGDGPSLGFVVETERQVEAHLNSHLDMLPAQDAKSRAIVEVMRDDEVAHADKAEAMGAVLPPVPVQGLMKAMAKVMTSTAYHI